MWIGSLGVMDSAVKDFVTVDPYVNGLHVDQDGPVIRSLHVLGTNYAARPVPPVVHCLAKLFPGYFSLRCQVESDGGGGFHFISNSSTRPHRLTPVWTRCQMFCIFSPR